jgi:hypothetical protein
MFRTYLTVGTVAGTADVTETSTAVLTLVSTNYSHVTKVPFYQPVKPDSRKLKELQHTHTQGPFTSFIPKDCFSLMIWDGNGRIFRCISDLPTLHRSFILVLSLAGGRRHHGASCYSELRKIRQCL